MLGSSNKHGKLKIFTIVDIITFLRKEKQATLKFHNTFYFTNLLNSGTFDPQGFDLKFVTKHQIKEEALMAIQHLAPINNKYYVYAVKSGKIVLIELSSTSITLIKDYEAHTTWVWKIEYNPDYNPEIFMTCSGDSNVKIFNYKETIPIKVIKGNTAITYVLTAKIDADFFLFTGNNGYSLSYKLTAANNFEEFQKYKQFSSLIWSMCHPTNELYDKYLLTGCGESCVQLNYIYDSQESTKFCGQKNCGIIQDILCLKNDPKLFLTSHNTGITLWSMENSTTPIKEVELGMNMYGLSYLIRNVLLAGSSAKLFIFDLDRLQLSELADSSKYETYSHDQANGTFYRMLTNRHSRTLVTCGLCGDSYIQVFEY